MPGFLISSANKAESLETKTIFVRSPITLVKVTAKFVSVCSVRI